MARHVVRRITEKEEENEVQEVVMRDAGRASYWHRVGA